MQKMDCHNFKEMLDSYFCEELTVETNHSIIHHAERCPSCRNEMASRRNLRQTLQRACAQDQMSNAACERLRAILHAEAEAGCKESIKNAKGHRRWWAELFSMKFAVPALAGSAILLMTVIGVAAYLQSHRQFPVSSDPNARLVAEFRLSPVLMAEAADTHRICGLHVNSDSSSTGLTDEVKEMDPGCIDLDKVAAEGAQGLPLCLAHVCGSPSRQFAHLIYRYKGQLVSLLVTSRDERALQMVTSRDEDEHSLQAGQIPEFAAGSLDAQQSQQTELNLDTYQTGKRVIMVVSALPKSENEKIARSLAIPVIKHLMRIENQTAFLDWPSFGQNSIGTESMASVRGGKLQ